MKRAVLVVCRVLQLADDIAEVPDAGFAGQPFGSATAPRANPLRLWASCFNSRVSYSPLAVTMCSPLASPTRWEVISTLASGCAARMICRSVIAVPEGASNFGGVVGLADGEFVAFELGNWGGETEERLHADGEVGAVEQSAALVRLGFQAFKLRVPAGGADNDARAQSQPPPEYFPPPLRER